MINKCPVCGSTRYVAGSCAKCGFLNNPNHLKQKTSTYKIEPNIKIESGPTKKYEHNKFEPEPGVTYEKPTELNKREVKK